MKKKLLITSILFCALVVTGCGKPQDVEVQTPKEKPPYFVDVSPVSQIKQGSNITKTGKIIGSQDIAVSSQISGRVSEIRKKIGEQINKNALVIKLTDSSGIYTFAAKRAGASLDQARINYDQTVLSLDKAISDTSLAIKQAKNQANTNSLGLGDSSAQLQLKQLESQLDKAKIDLQTKIDSDEQTINNFMATTQTLVKNVQLLYEDVINASDILLGVTLLNERLNDDFQQNLGARNSATKNTAIRLLRQSILTQSQVDSFPNDFDKTNLSSRLNQLLGYVNDLNPMLESIDTMLTYSITNSKFSQAQLDGYKAQINGLQAQAQGQATAITQQTNTVQSFLKTYKQQQDSIQKSLEGLTKQIASTKETLSSVSFNSNIGLESAQSAYNTTLKNKSTTQSALNNAIAQAQIAYAQAQNDLAKLTIETPIAGSIKDILVDIGQEVGPGTPLFLIDSSAEQQIEIALSQNEVQLVNEGQSVSVISDGKSYDATLASVSQSSNSTLSYKVIIRLNEKVPLLGSVAKVEIPLTSSSTLLPLKHVKIINTTQGIIYTYKNGSLEEKIISLGKIRGSNIEIVSDLAGELLIITTDISNFNENEFELKRKMK